MRIDRLDHLVLTVTDLRATLDFYVTVLGMREMTFGEDRKALAFGHSKINLHEAGHEFEPKARHVVPGSADLCFVTEDPLDEVLATLAAHGVPVEEGPGERDGALGQMRSVYVRDPDGNLVEICNYADPN
ncbi:VOC family protein [Lentzea sp. NPDC042327]|uniref:VOC family protein n=1 Tax=Lentzea sp. NPDC042327 TaxID=3154801 RepID=UPI003408BFC7